MIEPATVDAYKIGVQQIKAAKIAHSICKMTMVDSV